MTPGAGYPAEWVQVDRCPSRGAPALFLDRDGTLIENVPYLNDPEQVRLLDGAARTIETFRARGYAIVLVTNQSAVARGRCTPLQYRMVTARVQQLLGSAAADVIYACPYHPDGAGEYARDHPWRKPAGGMIRDAGQRFGLDIAASVLIGDSLSDIRAGADAGVGRLVHVLTGHGNAERPLVADFHANAGGRCVELLPCLSELRPCRHAA